MVSVKKDRLTFAAACIFPINQVINYSELLTTVLSMFIVDSDVPGEFHTAVDG